MGLSIIGGFFCEGINGAEERILRVMNTMY